MPVGDLTNPTVPAMSDDGGGSALELEPLWRMIEWRASATPRAVGFVDDRGRTIDFGSYREDCLRVAAAFHARGIRAGMRVAWQLPTWYEALVLAGALARVGAVQVPLIPILREREVSFILHQSEARVLVAPRRWRDVDYPALATAAIERAGTDVSLVVVDRDLPRADPATLPSWDDVREQGGVDPIRWVFYTSGTTSRPKGTLHTDRTIAACAQSLNLRFDMTADDANALVFPVTHIGGISWLMGGLMAGYRHILIEAFDARSSCEVLAREGVTVAGAGPAFWMAYVAEQRRHPERRVFPALRALVGGGAAKPSTIHDDVREVLGVVLATGYGSTECPALAHSGVHDPEDVLRSDGHALDGVEIRVVDPDGDTLPHGETGELLVNGPMLFKGYLDPADNEGAFDDGFFRTGDLGCVDERGLVRITGRVKDIIIRKGENISAKEVEDVLATHPAIQDVAIVGLLDTARGERCCAFVVPRDRTSAAVTLRDVVEHCERSGLARQKTPEQIEILPALPRNPTGKVLKQELRQRFHDPDLLERAARDHASEVG
jgi:acyl-CoA synthetase (AMP-forming)/AMP-acid ligase II